MRPVYKLSYYSPIIRTRDAELKGITQVDASVLSKSTPVFELTRSRRSKNNPNGSIDKTLDKISSITDSNLYVLDITSLENQTNNELESLLDYRKSFANWTTFLEQNFERNCMPVVHYTEPFNDGAFIQQLNRILSTFDVATVRVPLGSEGTLREIISTVNSLDAASRCYLILDAGYVSPKHFKEAFLAAERSLKIILDVQFSAVSVASSSFPSSVVAPGYGEDAFGWFKLSEVELHKALAKKYSKLRWLYSDYSTIHPLEFQGTVTNWVPRVDVPLNESLFYHRYRREDGGYIQAAKKVKADKRYSAIGCWGDNNIEMAALGEPMGKSPAHWIGVRVNIHVSRQIMTRSA